MQHPALILSDGQFLYVMMVELGRLTPVFPNARLAWPVMLSLRVQLNQSRLVSTRSNSKTISCTITWRCSWAGGAYYSTFLLQNRSGYLYFLEHCTYADQKTGAFLVQGVEGVSLDGLHLPYCKWLSVVGSDEVGVIWSIGQIQLFSITNHMPINQCAASLGLFLTTLLTVSVLKLKCRGH